MSSKSSKTLKSGKGGKKSSKPLKPSNDVETNKLSLFDHVKHIRGVKDPNYYKDLSEENRKTFNHFMLLRALAMDDEVVQEMAFLYRYFHLIPSAQFYTLLSALIPNQNRWVPWIKTKVVKHNSELLGLVSNVYSVSKRQANEYINVLSSTEGGKDKLVDLCLSTGLSEVEVDNLLDGIFEN